MAFREALAQVYVIWLSTTAMAEAGGEAQREAHFPAPDLSNFAGWYLHLLQESTDRVFRVTAALAERLPGFVTLSLVAAGERKVLKARFRYPGTAQEVQFSLRELSEGQRAIIGLQTLLHCLPEGNTLLCVDEPENFLALPEIAPWFNALYDLVERDDTQALLVSHHPRLINMLGDCAFWIEPDPNVGVARLKPIVRDESTEGLPLSQLVERGWIYDDEA